MPDATGRWYRCDLLPDGESGEGGFVDIRGDAVDTAEKTPYGARILLLDGTEYDVTSGYQELL